MSLVRHIWHRQTAGADRLEAWGQAVPDPAFVWGEKECPALAGGLGQAFKAWIAAHPADISLYHDGYGLEMLAPLDNAAHKILMVHQWPPRWKSQLTWLLRFTGKVVVCSAAERTQLHAALSWVPERFIFELPEPPLSPGPVDKLPVANEAPNETTGIWLQGSPWKLQGDRLRALADRWDTARDGRLQVLSGSPRPPRWQRKSGSRIDWQIGLSLNEALQCASSNWGQVLLLNDFDLNAPWLERLLREGCFPLVPDGDSPARLGGRWSEDAAPHPYAWGDMDDALELLQQARSMTAHDRSRFERWATGAFATDSVGFSDRYAALVEEIASQRPLRLRRHRKPLPFLPLAWYDRVHRIRTGR